MCPLSICSPSPENLGGHLLGWHRIKHCVCSTGNYLQYPIINHNEKQYKKNIYMCVCECVSVTEPLCCKAEINTALSISYIPIKLQKKILPLSKGATVLGRQGPSRSLFHLLETGPDTCQLPLLGKPQLMERSWRGTSLHHVLSCAVLPAMRGRPKVLCD